MRAKLTKRFIDDLTPADDDLFVWDTHRDARRGFGLRVKPTGHKAFILQYRNPQGRSCRYTVGEYGRDLTLEEARRKAHDEWRAYGGDPAGGRRADREAMTVAELCDEYIAAAESGTLILRRGKLKKASTLYIDKGRIARHIKPRLGRRLVADVTSRDVVKFQSEVIAGKTAADVKTGPRGRAIVQGGSGTAARTVGLLGGIFSYAVKSGYRLDNPVRGVDRPADKKRDVRVDAEHYAALGTDLLKAEERGEPWQATEAIWLLALTGCRKGEIEKLRWSDVDLDGRCLRLGDSKTGASVRPLGSCALKLLRERKATAKGDYVLSYRRGKPYNGLPKAWARIVKHESLRALTPHGLRHGFASQANADGCTPFTIAALLGHRSGSVTGGYVNTNVDDALLKAADKVSRGIWRAMTGDVGKILDLPTQRKARAS